MFVNLTHLTYGSNQDKPPKRRRVNPFKSDPKFFSAEFLPAELGQTPMIAVKHTQLPTKAEADYRLPMSVIPCESKAIVDTMTQLIGPGTLTAANLDVMTRAL